MAATRGRKAGFKMPDEHRTKIAQSSILSKLIKFAEGDEGVISKAQADVGLALMRKVLPDMSAVTISGDDEKDPIRVEGAASKLMAHLSEIEKRSGTTSGDPSE